MLFRHLLLLLQTLCPAESAMSVAMTRYARKMTLAQGAACPHRIHKAQTTMGCSGGKVQDIQLPARELDDVAPLS